MSNGGGFIGTLACSPVGSSLFAAFAAGSGAFYTDVNGPDNNCSPSRPVPILEIHGGSDRTVKYSGGQGDGGPQPSIPSWYVSMNILDNISTDTPQVGLVGTKESMHK